MYIAFIKPSLNVFNEILTKKYQITILPQYSFASFNSESSIFHIVVFWQVDKIYEYNFTDLYFVSSYYNVCL